jgi:hypothetical protein
MLNMPCATCGAKCAVEEAAAAKKFKCPKCGARLRRLPDGSLEILTPGTPPPMDQAATVQAPAFDAPPSAAPAEPASPPPATGLMEKFARQDEAKQNEAVLWGVGVVITGVAAGMGFMLKIPMLWAAALAGGLTAAAVAMYLKARARAFEAARRAVEQGKASAGPDATDLIKKV